MRGWLAPLHDSGARRPRAPGTPAGSARNWWLFSWPRAGSRPVRRCPTHRRGFACRPGSCRCPGAVLTDRAVCVAGVLARLADDVKPGTAGGERARGSARRSAAGSTAGATARALHECYRGRANRRYRACPPPLPPPNGAPPDPPLPTVTCNCSPAVTLTSARPVPPAPPPPPASPPLDEPPPPPPPRTEMIRWLTPSGPV